MRQCVDLYLLHHQSMQEAFGSAVNPATEQYRCSDSHGENECVGNREIQWMLSNTPELSLSCFCPTCHHFLGALVG